MKISAEKVTEIKRILIRQIGDNRECPDCHRNHIPNDLLARETFALYKTLKKEFALLGKRR